MVGIYDIHTMTKKVKRRIAEHIGVMRYDDSAFKVFEQVRIVSSLWFASQNKTGANST